MAIPISRAPIATPGPQANISVAAPPAQERLPTMLEMVLGELMRGGNKGGALSSLLGGGAKQSPEQAALLRAQANQAQATADNTQMDARKKAATEAFTMSAYGFYDPETGQQVPGSVDNLRNEGFGASTPDAILSLANRFGIPQEEAEAVAARMRTAYAQTPTSPLAATFTEGATAAPGRAPASGMDRFDAETNPAPAPVDVASVFTGGSSGIGGLPPVGGTDRESMIAGLNVAAGGNPFGAKDGVDVNRLQGNIDADLENNLAQQRITSESGVRQAQIQAGATVEGARIRAAADKDIAATRGAQDSLTQAFTPPTATQDELMGYLTQAVPKAAHDSIIAAGHEGYELKILARAQELMRLQGMVPAQAVATAATDYFKRGAEAGLGRRRQNTFNPNPPPVQPRDPRTFGATRTTVRDVGTATPPSPPTGGAPMPASKAELRPNTVYNTSRGPARWNGTAFEPVR